MSLQLKRVYDDPAPDDGRRILVDRVWPRRLSEKAAHVDDWLRELGPSTELRKWFAHDPARWEGVDELDGNAWLVWGGSIFRWSPGA